MLWHRPALSRRSWGARGRFNQGPSGRQDGSGALDLIGGHVTALSDPDNVPDRLGLGLIRQAVEAENTFVLAILDDPGKPQRLFDASPAAR